MKKIFINSALLLLFCTALQASFLTKTEQEFIANFKKRVVTADQKKEIDKKVRNFFVDMVNLKELHQEYDELYQAEKSIKKEISQKIKSLVKINSDMFNFEIMNGSSSEQAYDRIFPTKNNQELERILQNYPNPQMIVKKALLKIAKEAKQEQNK